MAKEELDRASIGASESAVNVKQQDVALLLKKKNAAEQQVESTEAEAHVEQAAVVAQEEALMVASADSVFASDGSYMVAQAGGAAAGGAAEGGLSTGTLLAIGGVALVAGGIAIAASDDDDGAKKVETKVTAPATVAEGGSIVFTVTGTPGAQYDWAISGTGIDGNDVSALTGTVQIGSDGVGTVSVNVLADNVTEGNETLVFTVNGATVNVTITDTSTTPPQAFTLDQNEVLVGTDGDDVFTAPLLETGIGIVQAESFQNGDRAEGGKGNDTLNLTLGGPIAAALAPQLVVDTVSVENVNILMSSGNAPRYLYLADDVQTVSVRGLDPTNNNGIGVAAQGANAFTLDRIDQSILFDLTASTVKLDVINTRTTALGVNDSTVQLVALPGDTDAAQTLNLGLTGNPALLHTVQLDSALTETLNITVSGGFFSSKAATDNPPPLAGDANTILTLTAPVDEVLADVTVGGKGDITLNLNEGISTLDASALQGGVLATLTADFNKLDSLLSSVKGGQGADYLTIVDALADGAVVSTNAGSDLLLVNGVNDGATTINLGAGDDVVNVADNSNGTLTIDGGDGDDSITINTIAAGKATTITAGAGDDFVDVTNVAHVGALKDTRINISLGDGNDTLDARIGVNLLDLLEAANIGPGPGFKFTPNVTADGGAGDQDTLILNLADAVDISVRDAASASDPDGVFNASVSGFERIDVSNTAFAASILDMDTLDGIDYLFLQGATAGSAINNIDSKGTVHFTAASTDLVVNVRDATLIGNNSDVLNIAATSAVTNAAQAGLQGQVNLGTVHAEGVETVNFQLTDTNAGAGQFQIVLDDEAATTVTVSGNAGLELTLLGGNDDNIVTLNASAVTRGGVEFDSANDNAAVTLTGGAGADILFGGDFIGTKEGTADKISGGAGDDVLGNSAGFDLLTGGAGNDIFVVGANANGNVYARITDFTVGDDAIDFETITGGVALNGFNSAQVSLGANAQFADFLNAAGTAGVGEVSWFQFNGNTYVVVDNGGAANTFENALNGDQVIEVQGLVDLSSLGVVTGYLGNDTAIG